MSTTDQMTDFEVDDLDSEPRLALNLGLREAEALRNWLLKPASDGTTALDDPLVNSVLVELGRAVDAVQATVNVRRELEPRHPGHEAEHEPADDEQDRVRDAQRLRQRDETARGHEQRDQHELVSRAERECQRRSHSSRRK